MAWEATYLLPLVLLVLLASGSWEQQPELLRTLEGETVSVSCRYLPQKTSRVKAWCRRTSAQEYIILATQPRLRGVPGEPRYFIQDYPSWGYFTVTMTELREKDSGFYWCATYELTGVFILRVIHLVVSRASTLPTTRSTRGTTAWISAISPVIDSPSGHWNLVSSVTVALLLLLALALLTVLYLSKTRGRASSGKDKSHMYDIATHEDGTVHRADPSPRQRESQLSWGSDLQPGSGEDTGDIRYASLSHLKHFGPEDSIYVNIHPNPQPTPDPFLAVEYACITKNRPQRSTSAALEEEPRT